MPPHRGRTRAWIAILAAGLAGLAACAAPEPAGGEAQAAVVILERQDPERAERWRAVAALGAEGSGLCERALARHRKALSRETRREALEALSGALRVLTGAVEAADAFLREDPETLPPLALTLCVAAVQRWHDLERAAAQALPPDGGEEDQE